MVLSLLIVALIAAAAWRGWLRGIYAETVDLVGMAAVTLAAVGTWQVAGPGPAVIAVLAGAIVVLALSARVARLAAGASSGGMLVLSRIAGSTFAAVWAVVLTTALLVMGTTAPGARAKVAGPVCDAPVARYLTVTDHPLHAAGQRLSVLARPVILWTSQQLFDTFTLAADRGLCADVARRREAADAAADAPGQGFRFPGADPGELAVDPEAEQEVLAALNAARRETGLPPVTADPGLAAVGRAHARDMYVRGYFAHETPECDAGREVSGCADPFDRIRAAGIDYDVAGENLALAPTAAGAHGGLMESPGHRANILAGDFTRVGIGVVSGPFGLMVTQIFAG